MKTKIIINPISGGGKNKDIEDIINKYLDKQRFQYDIHITTHPLHAKEIARQAIKEDYKAIIGVGGDGTINEIASEVIGTNISIGIIPNGSGNGFAFHFGTKKNIKESVLQLNSSQERTIDTGIANGESFINVSGIGFDAYIAKLFSISIERGLLNYIKLIFKNLGYKAQDYTIEYNDQRRKINAILISFANASQYGNNFKISPNAKTDDGLLDFVIINDMPRWKVPMFLLKIARGKIQDSRFVEIIKAKSMEIISNEEIIHLDGEPKSLKNDLTIKIKPQSLKILVPNE